MLATVSDKRLVTSTTVSLADIHSLQDYYPFGMTMKGRSASLQVNGGTTELAFQIDVDASPGNYQGLDRYRFGFQGQESDDEWIEGGAVSYKYRVHDPRIGRFFSVDPLAGKYPYNSQYAFSENSVIAFVELEGLEKFSVHSYSFAPFDHFGSVHITATGSMGVPTTLVHASFHGDGNHRKFGDAVRPDDRGNENYRVGGEMALEFSGFSDNKEWKDNAKAHGSLSTCHYGNGSTFSTFSDADIVVRRQFLTQSGSKQELSMKIWGNNDAAPGSWDIDIKVRFEAKYIKESKTLIISQKTFGDGFPSNETFLMDEGGNKLMLGAAGAKSSGEWGPFITLAFGVRSEPVSTASDLSIQLDESDNFKSVTTGDGTTYSLADWNAKFKGVDPKAATETHVGDNGFNVKNTDED